MSMPAEKNTNNNKNKNLLYVLIYMTTFARAEIATGLTNCTRVAHDI